MTYTTMVFVLLVLLLQLFAGGWQHVAHAVTTTPTKIPTHKPTKVPTHTPTHNPTHFPTHKPTKIPTHTPTHNPTHFPTHVPTKKPTSKPTKKPTKEPTHGPTKFPTVKPGTTHSPSISPTTSRRVITIFSAGYYNGNFGGQSGANAICQAHVVNASSDSWQPTCLTTVAMLSGQISNMIDLIPDASWNNSVEMYGPTGIEFSAQWSDLWTSVAPAGGWHSLQSVGLTGGAPWWTGTSNGVLAGDPCATNGSDSSTSWETGSFLTSGKVGDGSSSDRNSWTSLFGLPCSSSFDLICTCFGTVQATPSPSRSPTSPTASPSTSRPSKSPSQSPSTTPTNSPSTSHPSTAPSQSPSAAPTKSPSTSHPSKSPSQSPSHSPSTSPTPVHRVITLFSAGQYTGNFGEQSGANAICQATNASASGSTSWKPVCSTVVAMLSGSSSNMMDLIPDSSWNNSVEMYGPTGIEFSAQWSDLWSTATPSDQRHSLADVGLTSGYWWTGTTYGTIAGDPCGDQFGAQIPWATTSAFGKAGNGSSSDVNAWTSSAGLHCSQAYDLICACFGTI